MADNSTLNQNSSSGDVYRSKDRSGVKSQIVIIDWNTGGSETLSVPTFTINLPTGASTLAEQQSQTTLLGTIDADTGNIVTSVQLLDDAVATTGAAIPSKGFAISGTDGTNARIIKVDSNGELQVDVLTMPTVTVSATDLDIRDLTSATDSVAIGGTALTRLTDIETNTDSLAVVGNGAAATAQRVTLANDGTGVLATITTVTTVATVTTLVGSSIAHDDSDSGNPHKIGTKAQTSLADNTLVADNDRSNAFSDLDGVILSGRKVPLADIVRGLAAITDGSSTSVIASQGAGVKTYITDVIIANSSSSNVTVDLRDGTGGSVLATFPAPANGGVVHRLESPIPFSAATAVAADPSAAASTVTVTLLGFKSKV